MFFQVKMQQGLVPLMQLQVKGWKNSTNKAFSTKETRNKVPLKLRCLEVRKNVRLMFWMRKEYKKDKCYLFSGYKESNKLWLMYLERKPQEKRYGSYIFKLKWQKTGERTYLETSKEQTRYRWCFRCFRKGNNCVFGLCQQTSQVQCMYLPFTNVKISTKKDQEWSKN